MLTVALSMKMCDNKTSLMARHSFYSTRSRKQPVRSDTSSKSDVNMVAINKFPSIFDSGDVNRRASNGIGEMEDYYKRYEHDITPVRDDSSYNDHSHSEGTDGLEKDSITNSDLGKLEAKVFQKISQELQTKETSKSSLESNIKLLKSTVQQIFDKFYNNMQEYELYKRRFHNILLENKDDIIVEMEEFIKDIIQHIISSQSSISEESKLTDYTYTCNVNERNAYVKHDSEVNLSTVTYKNEHYLTDSATEESSSKKTDTGNEGTFNIYLLSGSPCVEIKMNDRYLLSEINIKESYFHEDNRCQIASADNIMKLASKQTELENYIRCCKKCPSLDRDIPVKISYAKRDIHLNQDFVFDTPDDNKSFIYKICNYICRKFRKNSVI